MMGEERGERIDGKRKIRRGRSEGDEKVGGREEGKKGIEEKRDVRNEEKEEQIK